MGSVARTEDEVRIGVGLVCEGAARHKVHQRHRWAHRLERMNLALDLPRDGFGETETLIVVAGLAVAETPYHQAPGSSFTIRALSRGAVGHLFCARGGKGLGLTRKLKVV